jgi:hypothetical protein
MKTGSTFTTAGRRIGCTKPDTSLLFTDRRLKLVHGHPAKRVPVIFADAAGCSQPLVFELETTVKATEQLHHMDPGHHGQRPSWKRAHRDWRFWVGLFLCLWPSLFT